MIQILAILAIAFPSLSSSVSALSSKSENLVSVELAGDIEMDVCKEAKANIGNNNYQKNMGEAYCEDFVIDVCRKAGVPQSIVPSDNGSVNHFYTALINCGATVVNTPTYGDIVIYVINSNNDKCHAALYTKGSGVNTGDNDSIQGNLGGVIKEAKVSNYYTTCNDKKLTVANGGLSVIYVRPRYKDSATIASSLNQFNDKMTVEKDGDYVISDITKITFYSAPCASAEKFTLKAGIFKSDDKLRVNGFYNGFVRIVQIKNESCNDTGRARTRAYGSYVKFTDLAIQAFNFNKKPVTEIYKVNDNVKTRSAPCVEGAVKRTISSGSFIKVTYAGNNHISGHRWGITAEGEYIYLSSSSVTRVTIGSVSVNSFKVTGILLWKKLSVSIKTASNANMYKVEFIDVNTGKVAYSEEKNSLSFNFDKPTKNHYYKVRITPAIKLYNGKIFYGNPTYSGKVQFK